MECGVAAVNSRGELILLSAVARDILALSDRACALLTQLPDEIQALATSVLNGTGNPLTQDVRLPLGDGRIRVLNVSAFPIAFTPGDQGVMMVIQGFKNGNPLESRIRHLERLGRLGMLSAGVAHELRNAMVAATTFSEMVLEKEQDNELVHTVRRELGRANSLAAQMLRHARSTQTAIKLVSVHEVLHCSLALAHSRLKKAHARLTTDLLAAPDTVEADDAHLEQVFLNLLINAAEAIPEGGQIRLSTSLVTLEGAGQMLKLTVADSGCGVAREVMPMLFKPFFTTKRHGTGLGLYLAQRIIHEHSGTISLDSTEGAGTQVNVLLPSKESLTAA